MRFYVKKYLQSLTIERLLELIDDYGFYVSGIERDKKNTKSWFTFEKWVRMEYKKGNIR